MHNNIMAAGLRDHPPMLDTGRYAQWQPCFLIYIDIRPNGDALRKCILKGPYKLTTVTIPATPATDDSLSVVERTIVETLLNMSLENKARYQSKKEAIHLLLIRIGHKIYLTVDACKTAHDMWITIERLQHEWSRFVTIVKQNHDLDIVSYHKLFDVLKQLNNIQILIIKHQNLTKSYAPPSKTISSTSFFEFYHNTKAKEIAKPITPPSESAFEEDSDPEQAQRDRNMQKNLALIAKYFKKIYKPTNNNLKTSSNLRNKNVDTSPRESVGSQVVQQIRIHCFNCKEFGHFAKECMKPKRVKEFTYHKEKMLLYKQAEKGVSLQEEQADWLEDTDEEIDEQELEAHYSYMAKIQEVPTTDSRTDTEPLEKVQYDVRYNVFANERQHSEQPEYINNTCVVEKVDSNVIPDSPDMCDNDIQTDQNAKECDDERAMLSSLIANLTLDTERTKRF
ncbi:integrase, catalytic region, zinc finger, CCHC-type containing protein [Tanacetum coccineum]